MRYWDALFAFLAAAAVAAALTPLARRLAWRVGAVVMPSDRGLAEKATPALGGLAILAGVLVASAIWLPATINLHHTAGTAPGSGGTVHTWTIIAGACLITLVGAIDDVRPLTPQWKLLGQVAAAVIAVEGGAVVTDVTVPFVGTLQLPNTGGVLTVIWLVGLMNVVNFSDGVDGLAAGLCTIDAIAFSIIAFDLHVSGAGVLAALTAGAALGFLFHNFYPASIFMGDSGANLLGYLLGVVAVVGSIKTGAVVTLVVPLVVLAVPFLDTGFVVAKRLKYRRKPWSADANHFHHRMARMGFTPRRTVAYLYGWTLMLAGVAVALRFVPYSNHRGSYHLGWLLVMGGIVLVALAASVYLIYLLEILKFRSRRARELRTADPSTSEHEIDERVQRDVETGEFERVGCRRDEQLTGLTRAERAILAAIAVMTVLAGVTRYAHGVSRVIAFVFATLALAGLAWIIALATEQVGERLGPAATGLMHSTVGNLPEFFVVIFALQAGQRVVAETAIVGSILVNALLVLGLVIVVGASRERDGVMRFNPRLPNDTATLLLVSTFMIVLIGLTNTSSDPASHHAGTISIIGAVAILVVYATWLRQYLTSPGSTGAEAAGSPRLGLVTGIVLLVTAGTASAFVSDWFINALQPTIDTLHFSEAFAGLVIVAIASNAVENVAGVALAAKGRSDLAISVVKNSVSQIAAFLYPLLVLVSLLTATHLTFSLAPVYIGALLGTAVIVWQITGDGEATVFEGTALIAAYVILATVAAFE